MKKVLSLILALVLLLGASCVSAQEDFAACQQATVDTLLSFLSAETARYEPMLWALDAAEAYCTSPSWEGWVKAQAAVYAVCDFLKTAPQPVNTVTASMVETLNKNRVEWQAATDNADIFAENHVNDFPYWECYYQELLYFGLSREELASLNYSFSVRRKKIEAELRWDVLAANYLFLTVKEPLDGKTLWEQLKANEPVLAPYMESWYESTDEVECQMMPVFELLEATVEKSARSTGIQNYLLGEDLLERSLIRPEGMPMMLPLPDCMELEELSILYALEGEDGSDPIEVLDNLETMPEFFSFGWRPENQEEVDAYLGRLNALGIEYTLQEPTAGENSAFSLAVGLDGSDATLTYNGEWLILSMNTKKAGLSYFPYLLKLQEE